MREIAVNVGKLSVRADWEKYFFDMYNMQKKHFEKHVTKNTLLS